MSIQDLKIMGRSVDVCVNIRNFGNYTTPRMIVSDLEWEIKIRRHSIDGVDVVSVLLLCCPSSEMCDLDWSCEANATISLNPNDLNQRSYKKEIQKIEFGNELKSSECTEFIKWADFKKYEKDGKVILSVHLSAKPVKFNMLPEMEQTRARFRFTVKDISELSEAYSPEMMVRGIKWRIFLRKYQAHLEIFLEDRRDERMTNKTLKAKCSFKLLSFNEDVQPIQASIHHSYNENDRDWGFPKWIKWNELMKPEKKYVVNDTAIFEIDLEVDAPKSDWEIANPEADTLECSICFQSIIGREPTATKCGHLFCNACITRSIDESKKCPLCNIEAATNDLRLIYISE